MLSGMQIAPDPKRRQSAVLVHSEIPGSALNIRHHHQHGDGGSILIPLTAVQPLPDRLLLMAKSYRVPGLTSRVPGLTSRDPVLASCVPGLTSRVPGLTSRVPGLTSRVPGLTSRAPDCSIVPGPNWAPGHTVTLD